MLVLSFAYFIYVSILLCHFVRLFTMQSLLLDTGERERGRGEEGKGTQNRKKNGEKSRKEQNNRYDREVEL